LTSADKIHTRKLRHRALPARICRARVNKPEKLMNTLEPLFDTSFRAHFYAPGNTHRYSAPSDNRLRKRLLADSSRCLKTINGLLNRLLERNAKQKVVVYQQRYKQDHQVVDGKPKHPHGQLQPRITH